MLKDALIDHEEVHTLTSSADSDRPVILESDLLTVEQKISGLPNFHEKMPGNDLNHCIKFGYLQKRPQLAANLFSKGKRNLWPKRFVVITQQGELLIYRNEKMASQPEKFLLLSSMVKAIEKDSVTDNTPVGTYTPTRTSNFLEMDLISPAKTVRFYSKDVTGQNSIKNWLEVITKLREKLTENFLTPGKVDKRPENVNFQQHPANLSPGKKSKIDTITENYQKILNQILAKNSNCVDCHKPNPNWCSLNLGIIFCLNCSGVHRNLGVNISKVRSLTIDKLTIFDLVLLYLVGNQNFNQFLGLGSGNSHIQNDDKTAQRVAFINQKYKNVNAEGLNSNWPEQLQKILTHRNGLELFKFLKELEKTEKYRELVGQKIGNFTEILVQDICQAENMSQKIDFDSFSCLAVILHAKMIIGPGFFEK